jgi:hypothetical protein
MLRHVFIAVICSSLMACGDPPEEAPRGEPEPAAAAATPSGTAAGTIEAELGADRRTWTSLYVERDGNPQSTSTYQTRRIGSFENRSLSLAGHVGTSLSPIGSLRIELLATEALEGCPCTFEDARIEYMVDFPDDRRTTESATLTIERFTANGDGTFAAVGSFSGTLTREGDGERLPVTGTFQIDRILRVGQGS